MEAEVKVNAGEIMTRLARLQASVDYIREHIDDTTLTDDDLLSIKEAKEDLKKGRTRRL
mgnify:CR=1 FL=1